MRPQTDTRDIKLAQLRRKIGYQLFSLAVIIDFFVFILYGQFESSIPETHVVKAKHMHICMSLSVHVCCIDLVKLNSLILLSPSLYSPLAAHPPSSPLKRCPAPLRFRLASSRWSMMCMRGCHLFPCSRTCHMGCSRERHTINKP